MRNFKIIVIYCSLISSLWAEKTTVALRLPSFDRNQWNDTFISDFRMLEVDAHAVVVILRYLLSQWGENVPGLRLQGAATIELRGERVETGVWMEVWTGVWTGAVAEVEKETWTGLEMLGAATENGTGVWIEVGMKPGTEVWMVAGTDDNDWPLIFLPG